MKTIFEKTYEQLIDECLAFHGHICIGQAIGIRLALAGMKAAEIPDSGTRELIIVVENDRCIADALMVLTGCRLGRRTMKLRDYGKMAATFFNEKTGKAYRVSLNAKGFEKFKEQMVDDKIQRSLNFLNIPEDEMVNICEVKLNLSKYDMPGKPLKTTICPTCGEKVMDNKDINDYCFSCKK